MSGEAGVGYWPPLRNPLSKTAWRASLDEEETAVKAWRASKTIPTRCS